MLTFLAGMACGVLLMIVAAAWIARDVEATAANLELFPPPHWPLDVERKIKIIDPADRRPE
jgi:hypothetical protein